MIIGTGIDVVFVNTIEQGIENYTAAVYFAEFCTEREIEYCINSSNSAQCAASRFAAKEAAMKALSTGWIEDIEMQDFEIINEQSGKPKLLIYGKPLEILKAHNFSKSWVSLSHTPEFVIAQVIFER